MDEQKVDKNEHVAAANEQEENIEVPDDKLSDIDGGRSLYQGHLNDKVVKIMKFGEEQRRKQERAQQGGGE